MVAKVREQVGVRLHLPEVRPWIGCRPEVRPGRCPFLRATRFFSPLPLPRPLARSVPVPRDRTAGRTGSLASRTPPSPPGTQGCMGAEQPQRTPCPHPRAGGQDPALATEVAQPLLDSARRTGWGLISRRASWPSSASCSTAFERHGLAQVFYPVGGVEVHGRRRLCP